METLRNSVRFLFICIGALAITTGAHAASDLDAKRHEAFTLMENGNFVVALPLLEMLAQKNKDDMLVYHNLALALGSVAANAKDDATEEALRRRAMAAANRAKELGDSSDILAMVLEAVSQPKRSARGHSLVAQLIRDASSAFNRADYREALAKYKNAHELEPKRYDVLCFIGSTYFALKQWDDAIAWYTRAIEINPDGEIAHRWWGDALMWKRKPKESRDKYIDAIVAEPYNQKTHMGIKKWMEYAKANGVKFRITNPVINVPMDVKGSVVNFATDFGKGTMKGQAAWVGYGTTLVLEKAGNAFEREVKAFKTVVEVARESGYTKDTQGLDPSLATLLQLDEKGLLEAYILFKTKNQEVAEQYPVYRNKHRENLRRYWAEEVIQLQ